MQIRPATAPFKVIQVTEIKYQSKAHMRVINNNLHIISYCFEVIALLKFWSKTVTLRF